MKGVSFDKNKGKYKAYADIFGTRVTIGSTFMSASAAYDARNQFVNKIFNSRYPLATFLCDRFNISFNKALSLIATAITKYVSCDCDSCCRSCRSVGTMFPSFAVAFAAGCVCGGSEGCGGCEVDVNLARSVLLSLPNDIADIIFGHSSIRSSSLRYEYAIKQLNDIANELR